MRTKTPKQETINDIQKILTNKNGKPNMQYLKRLTEEELLWLYIDIVSQIDVEPKNRKG